MFDVTVGETKEFELLPEDTWIPVRLASRSVIKYDGVSYKPSTDDLLKRAFDVLVKANKAGDEEAIAIANEDLRKFQFQFTFKPLVSKKFAGYRVQGNTGLYLSFRKPDGEFAPNKLAKYYLGLGGKQVGKGENVNIDSVLGNYGAIKVQSEKNKKTSKVYQRVADIRELNDVELAQAKIVELDLKKIEDAIRAAEEKSFVDAGPSVSGEPQIPILEQQSGLQTGGKIPF